MPAARRVWCSCTTIDYLKGEPRAKPHCDLIINDCIAGNVEIVVSVLSHIEVAKVGNLTDDDAEARIQEFFNRPYVVSATIDLAVAREARRLVRTYSGLKPLDAVHVATALRWNIPILETYDDQMIGIVNGREGNQPLVVRHPTYEGTMPLFT